VVPEDTNKTHTVKLLKIAELHKWPLALSVYSNYEHATQKLYT
jgi:hypothetical protein